VVAGVYLGLKILELVAVVLVEAVKDETVLEV
jgi:hypothetical protein